MTQLKRMLQDIFIPTTVARVQYQEHWVIVSIEKKSHTAIFFFDDCGKMFDSVTIPKKVK